MTSKLEKIRNIYRQVIATELTDENDFAKGLMSTEVEVEPEKKEEEKKERVFTPPEEFAKELGAGEPGPKETPILTHREKEPASLLFPKEMESSKFTPGAMKGKVCDICGRFNFPPWKTECSYCKRTYDYMKDLIDFYGITLSQAAEYISAGHKMPTEETAGMMIAPERLSTKRKTFLTKDQLKEIWTKGGKILLPALPETLDQRFEDKKGLIGVPNVLKLQYALETQLNVERYEKDIFDPKTHQKIKVKDVYFDDKGLPIPIKAKDRDFFSLMDIAKKLKLDPTGVLKQISEHNITSPIAIKPAIYYDDNTQAFSWKKSIEPIFKDRIKEVYEMSKNEFLHKLSKRKEKLDEQIYNLDLTRTMLSKNKEKIKSKIVEHPQKRALEELFKLRQEAGELIKKITTLGEKPERIELIEKLNKINETKAPLEKIAGKDLDVFTKQMNEATKEINRTGERVERMKQSRIRIMEQAKEYIEAVGKPGQSPDIIAPIDLQKVQTGHSTDDISDVDVEAELIGKKAHKINSFLKLGEEQLELPFPSKEEEEETKQKEIKIKNIIKGRITHEEAEDRLIAANDPLSNEEDLTPEQKKERTKKINTLTLNHPTREEAIARLELAEIRPVKSAPIFRQPAKEMTEDLFEERECPHCGKKKITKGTERCMSCGFISAPNRKDVVIEQTKFKLVRDKNGNLIPKLDDSGNQEFDDKGNPKFIKRPEKQYSLVSVQYGNLGQLEWATARKISGVTPDPGAKTKEEKEQYYKKIEKEVPRIRDIKPLTKTPEDFRHIYEFVTDEKTGKEVKTDTGEKEHKQQCSGCAEPWVKVKPENFSKYPTIEEAINFINNEELSKNTKAYMFKELYQPKKEEPEKQMTFSPTILPTSSTRFERILKLSKMP